MASTRFVQSLCVAVGTAFLLIGAGSVPAAAQDWDDRNRTDTTRADTTVADTTEAVIPRVEEAERLFQRGLNAFQRGDYAEAYRRFSFVNEYRLNRKTTAALLMGAKALYRLGDYRQAQRTLQRLLERYPATSYRAAAKELMRYAQQAAAPRTEPADTLRLGVALPMRPDDVPLTQALFSGLRLAVDRANGVRRRLGGPQRRLRVQGDTTRILRVPVASVLPDSQLADILKDDLTRYARRQDDRTRDDTLRVQDVLPSERTRLQVPDSLRQRILAQADTGQVLINDDGQFNGLGTTALPVIVERTGPSGPAVKMVFRNSGGTARAARAAVDSLTRLDDVDLIIGPLYSEEARAAGAVAERAEVPMVAPLATDTVVSAGRRYVFQANPTFPVRGAQLARFARQGILLRRVGIFVENSRLDANAERIRGFRQEARARGLEVAFVKQLPGRRSWSRLPETIEADSMLADSTVASVDGFYLPIAGRNASGRIQDALTGIGRLSTIHGKNYRVLGTSEWHDLPIKVEASKFRTTYASDFYVAPDNPAVRTFRDQFRLLTGRAPEELPPTPRRLAYTGYDIGRMVTQLATRRPPASMARALRQMGRYEGLGVRVDFGAGTVNQAMYFLRYQDSRLELVR